LNTNGSYKVVEDNKKVKIIHFKFLGVFRYKNDRKWDENARNLTRGAAIGVHVPVPYPYAPGKSFLAASGDPACASSHLGAQLHAISWFCLFSKIDRCKKPNFLILNPK